MPRLPALVITDAERAELERRSRAHTTSQQALRRARIILLAADGVPNRQIATQVGIGPDAVATWRRRFASERLKGLQDRRRPGRPRVYDHDVRLKIVATVTTEQPSIDSHWSARLVAKHLAEEHYIPISASQVGRILADLDLKPHLVRGWLNRPDDPAFFERAADVCGLYLDKPQGALVLSVDEKTAIAARSRTHPTRPATPGMVCHREFEYCRHGTACLMAALDVHSGQVLGRDMDRNDSAHFIDFLAEIDRAVPPELAIHLVLDNGSSHVSKQTKGWLVAHPRFHAHYTPKHASWLNQVELFFSILTRRLLKRGEFASRAELVAKMMAFIVEYDRTARPFRWTYDGTPLKVA
jgi:transposase